MEVAKDSGKIPGLGNLDAPPTPTHPGKSLKVADSSFPFVKPASGNLAVALRFSSADKL